MEPEMMAGNETMAAVNEKQQVEMLKPQKILKKKGLIVLIALLGMVGPLTTDMYLPALPSMVAAFNSTSTVVNMTLVIYFLFMAIGILIWGPLSDKYGRKKIMLVALLLYTGSCICCACAGNIWFLIALRAFQALGAGGMVAVSTALVKDCFDGKFRDAVLGIVQSLTMLAPMIAPLLGAQVLRIFSWRGSFGTLAVIGGVTFILGCLFEESLPKDKRNHGGLGRVFSRLGAVVRNVNFTYFLLMIALINAPYMAYISVSSYVYVDFFGLSETMYSVMFAINSLFCFTGPLVLMRIKNVKRNVKIVVTCYLAALCAGIALILFGSHAAWTFLICFAPFTAVGTGLRPYATAILLEQQEGDTGSASSVINFTFTAMGTCGLLIGSLIHGSLITGLGTIIICSGTCSIIMFIGLLLMKLPVKGFRQQ